MRYILIQGNTDKITEDINVNKMRELRLGTVNNDYDCRL